MIEEVLHGPDKNDERLLPYFERFDMNVIHKAVLWQCMSMGKAKELPGAELWYAVDEIFQMHPELNKLGGEHFGSSQEGKFRYREQAIDQVKLNEYKRIIIEAVILMLESESFSKDSHEEEIVPKEYVPQRKLLSSISISPNMRRGFHIRISAETERQLREFLKPTS